MYSEKNLSALFLGIFVILVILTVTTAQTQDQLDKIKYPTSTNFVTPSLAPALSESCFHGTLTILLGDSTSTIPNSPVCVGK